MRSHSTPFASSRSRMSSESLALSSRFRIRTLAFISFLSLPHAAGLRRRFVDQRPEYPQVDYGFHELIEMDWLDHIGVHAQPVALHQIAFFARGGQDYDGNGPEFVVGFNAAQHLQSIDFGHLEIEQDDGGIASAPVGELLPPEQDRKSVV